MKLLALTVLAVLATGVAIAQSFRSQTEAVDRQICKAMMAKDFAKLEKILYSTTTADFVYLENGQKQDRKTMIENMRQGIQSMKSLSKAQVKTVSVKETGDKAVASRQHVMEGTMMGPDKKDHKMSFSGVSQDLFVRVKGKWLIKRMEWRSQKMLMDGKPMGSPTGG
jgi:hypothetical protein